MLYPLLALQLALAAPTTFPQAPDATELASTIELVREKSRAPGVSVAIMVGDELAFAAGFGMADLEHQAPVIPETVFRIASLTKQFTSAAILKLAEEERLSLDAPFTDYIEVFDTGGREISVRQLLDHTSGIANLTSMEAWFKTWERRSSPAEVIGLLEGVDFDFEPGSAWSYNNSAYVLAGLVLEERCGVPYAQFLGEQLFVPLELSSMRYDTEGDIVPHRARGYSVAPDGPHNATIISMTQPFAAGALLATASDLVRWERALMTERVLTAESFKQMITPAVLPDGTSAPSGLGLFPGQLHGFDVFDHSGGIQGFATFLLYCPESGIGISVLANGEGFPAGQLARELAVKFLMPELVDLPVPTELASELLGSYESAELKLRVRAKDGVLRATLRGRGFSRLVYQGEREFRWAGDLRRRLVFLVNEAGTLEVRVHADGEQIVAPKVR